MSTYTDPEIVRAGDLPDDVAAIDLLWSADRQAWQGVTSAFALTTGWTARHHPGLVRIWFDDGTVRWWDADDEVRIVREVTS